MRCQKWLHVWVTSQLTCNRCRMKNTTYAALELQVLTQAEAAATLQEEMGELQQQLSTEHNLVVEAQVIISATQVLWLPTPC